MFLKIGTLEYMEAAIFQNYPWDLAILTFRSYEVHILNVWKIFSFHGGTMKMSYLCILVHKLHIIQSHFIGSPRRFRENKEFMKKA